MACVQGIKLFETRMRKYHNMFQCNKMTPMIYYTERTLPCILWRADKASTYNFSDDIYIRF